MTYARLFIPDLPEAQNLKRILYSDVDVIFVDDIRKMYDEDLEGKLLGAVSYINYDYLGMNILKNYLVNTINAPNDINPFQGGNLLLIVMCGGNKISVKKL